MASSVRFFLISAIEVGSVLLSFGTGRARECDILDDVSNEWTNFMWINDVKRVMKPKNRLNVSIFSF